MANYQHCKIRLYPRSTTLDEPTLRAKCLELKADNNIHETVFAYYSQDWSCAEIRFTAKHFPDTIERIFPAATYDMWVLWSDAGGGSDQMLFYTDRSGSGEVLEAKAYSFDRIQNQTVSDVSLLSRCLKPPVHVPTPSCFQHHHGRVQR